MSVQHFFHYYRSNTCLKFVRSSLVGNNCISKYPASTYCKVYPSFNSLKVPTAPSLFSAVHFSYDSPKTLDVDANTIGTTSTEMVRTIRQEASSSNKMVLSLSDATISKCVQFLEGIEMPPQNIQNLLVSHPDILWVNEKKWQNILCVLSNFGLSNQLLCQVLEKLPGVLRLSPGNMDSVIETLRQIGIFDKNLPLMIAAYPEILHMSASTISKRFKQLQFYFKTDDVLMLIRRSPSILVDDWESIEKKFHYVFGVMGITQPQMRHSNLFSHSLEHIQTRHLWMERCGFFQKFKAKEDKKRNPRLGSIIDSSDQVFAKKFGNMSLKEYKTFKILIQNQVDNLEEDLDFEDD